MRDINTFVNDLTSEDINLIDKLQNLNESGELDELTDFFVARICGYDSFTIANNDKWVNYVEDYIRVGAKNYMGYILEQTDYLFENKLIDSEDDYSSGLYNCDNLYLDAIHYANIIDTWDCGEYCVGNYWTKE